MKLESIALHHGYESEKNDQKSATTPIYQTLLDLPLIIHNMEQIYLTSKSREIFIQE